MNYFSNQELRFLLNLLESHIDALAHHGATPHVELLILKQKIYEMIIEKGGSNENRQ